MGKKSLDDEVGSICNAELVEENWTAIMAFCDRMASSEMNDCTEVTRAIAKRLKDKNPRTISFAISLTHACIENAGRNFRLAVCSRDFMAAIKQVLDPKNASKLDSKVRRRLAGLMLTWQKEFGDDAQLFLVKSTIQELRQQGVEFDESNASTGLTADPRPAGGAAAPITSFSSSSPTSATSAAALRKKEEEDLKKAIEASLKDVAPPAVSISSSSLYPTLATSSNNSQPTPAAQSPAKKARVLYDFDAGEPNELNLRAGEVVRVLDDSDSNWWKGESATGHQGFFPAAFVSFDLYARPQPVVVPPQQQQQQQQQQQHLQQLQQQPQQQQAVTRQDSIFFFVFSRKALFATSLRRLVASINFARLADHVSLARVCSERSAPRIKWLMLKNTAWLRRSGSSTLRLCVPVSASLQRTHQSCSDPA